MKTQYQLREETRKENAEVQQEALYMMGKMPDDNGYIKNPLSQDEINAIATSDKPYASTFRAYATVG